MIKLINIITQNIILLGCCAISIFILFVLITFIKNDPITGDLYDEWYQIDSTLICDYCIIPEADYILKEDTSFLN